MPDTDILTINGTDYKIHDSDGRALVAPEELTSTAAAAHAVGDPFVYGGKLCRATDAIAIGDTIATTGAGANCEEVPGGLGGEVASLQTDCDQLNGKVNSMHGLVDYNNEIPYHRVYDITYYTGFIDRSGIRFVFNGACTSGSTSAKVIVNNPETAVIFTGTAPSTSATYALKLTNGHVYRARMRNVSGEKTNNVTIRINKAGAVSAIGNTYTDKLSGDSICDFTYDSDTYPNGINIIVQITRTSTGNTLTNYTVDITLEDITDGATGQIYTDVAPAELETATENHVVGELIICKNQLYEVTDAIAAGETITPGTNVSATTIAAQLAAVKAQLANI